MIMRFTRFIRNIFFRTFLVVEMVGTCFVFGFFVRLAWEKLIHVTPYFLVSLFFLVILLSNVVAKLAILYIQTYEDAI